MGKDRPRMGNIPAPPWNGGILMAKKEKLLLIILIGLGFFLRVSRLSDLMGFDYDQEVAMEAVERILSGRPTLIGQQTSVGGVFIGPGYYYLLALFTWIFGGNPLGWGVMVALISVGTMVALFILTRGVFGKTTAFLTLAIYATNAKINFYDRTTAPSNPVMLASIITVLLLWLVKSGKRRLIPLLALTVTTAVIHFHPSTISLVPLSAVLWLYWKIKRPSRREILLSIAAVLLAIGPLLAFDLRHGWINISGVIRALGDQGNEAYVWILKSLATFRTQVENLSSFFAVGGMGAFIALIMMVYWFRDKRNERALLSYWILIPVLTLSFYRAHIPEYYLLTSFPALIIGIAAIENSLLKKMPLVGALVVLGIIAVNLAAIGQAKNPYSLKNKRDVARFIKQKGIQEYMVTFDTDPGLEPGFGYILKQEGVSSTDSSPMIFTIVMPESRRSMPGKETTLGGIKVIESFREVEERGG